MRSDDTDAIIERHAARARRFERRAREAINQHWRSQCPRELRKAAAARMRADRIAIMQAQEQDA
jgi:hypothetical protein